MRGGESGERLRLAYLASRYPLVSHTFIRREVEALRRRGLVVETFSLRPSERVLSELDRQEFATTWTILPTTLARLARDHLGAVRRRPRRYFSTLAWALHHRMPGARETLWAVFHFAEAILLARELERRGVEHLHTHFSNAGGTVGMLAARYAALRWSLTLHGSADFDTPTRSLLGEKIEQACFVACVSYFGRGLAMRLSDPAHWDRIHIVRCGIERHRPSRSESLPSAGQRMRVLAVGRLSSEKGFLGLVDAFAHVIGRGVDAELRIVGEGEERGALEARIAHHGLQHRCSLPGSASEEGVREELAQAHVFAMSSFMEGLPVSIMEAMDAGLPVVAPRVAGIPELVEDTVSGFLFTPTRWDELADALCILSSDAERRSAMGEEGKKRLAEEFEIDRAVEPLIALLQASSRVG